MNLQRWHAPVWRHFFAHVLGLLALQTLARLLMHATFFRASSASPVDMLQAYFFGLRFDLRIAVLGALPLLLVACVPWLRRWLHPQLACTLRTTRFTANLWAAYFAALTALWFVLTCTDFGNMAYWNVRMDATLANYLGDWRDNAVAMWQSYPVLRLLAVMLLLASAAFWLSRRRSLLGVNPHAAQPPVRRPRWYVRLALNTLLVFVTLFAIHGRWSQYPLRWSDAAAIGQADMEQLALNPVQQVADTLAYRAPQFDLQAARAGYARMAQWLGVTKPDVASFNVTRQTMPLAASIPLLRPVPANANVVLIILESFSGYKTTMFGNRLDPTPFVKQLADEGWIFPRFASAHPGTARGVYSIITSGPDVALGDTASRNPKAIQHRSYIADFPDHQPFYFIGGSTSWANVRGVLTKSVPGIRIFEESDYRYPRADVWGVSDRNLMLESARMLDEYTTAHTKQPFFAVIQTAANHRPYTIPPDSDGFVPKQLSSAELHANGFDNNEEFNAFRLLDYSLQRFFARARQSPWFNNTIFVMCGDHGIPNAMADNMPPWLQRQELAAINTPLILYAPAWLKPHRFETMGQQADILPTLLALTDRQVPLRTIGRNLLADNAAPQGWFWIDHGGPSVGWFDGSSFMRLDHGQPQAELFDVLHGKPETDIAATQPQQREERQRFLEAYFEAARYLMMHGESGAP